MNTFSVDEYLGGGIDDTWSWGWCSDIDRYVLTIRDSEGISVIGTQLFKKGEHAFERLADPSVIVTAI